MHAPSAVKRCATLVCSLVWLLCLIRPGLAADAMAELSPDGIQRATILVDSYSYEPDHLIVRRGVPVELTLKSLTWLVPHNFVIDAPEAGLELDEDVPSGKAITIRFTPAQEGSYQFLCDKRLLFFRSHEDKGMAGTLEVRAAEVERP